MSCRETMVAYRCATTFAAMGLLDLLRRQVLHVGGGYGLLLCSADERELMVNGQCPDRVQVAASDVPVLVVSGDLLHGRIEVEHRQEFGDFPLRLAGLTRQVALGVPVGVAQTSQGVSQVKRVHVEALPVLDDLVEQHFILLGRLHPARDLAQARFACRVVAAFTGDDAVAVLAFQESDGDRLEDAEPLHRVVEFLLRPGVELATGLVGIGLDARDFNEERPAEPAAAVDRAMEGSLRRERQRGLLAERLVGRGERCLDCGAESVVRFRRRGPGRRWLRGCVGHRG